MNRKNYYIETDYYQVFKNRQHVGGDVFLSNKNHGNNRIVSVLADGLGSGIKANVLATLTTSMASCFITNQMNIKKTASIIMETLPVCKKRKIGYSTFTIVDMETDGTTKILEHDNPDFILVRNNKIVEVSKDEIFLETTQNRKSKLKYSNLKILPEDRIIFFSDGVTQSGLGKRTSPLGWGLENLKKYINEICNNEEISARELAKKIVKTALKNDNGKAADDITCGVIYFRKPRELLLVSGPPYNKEDDPEYARRVENFSGKKIICGGTSANIVARELNKKIKVDLKNINNNETIPPIADMKGIDLITEGTITLSKLKQILERYTNPEEITEKSLSRLTNLILNSDRIKFLVGTKINEAHQDPKLPQELEIRRNLIKRISSILSNKFNKETDINFI